MDMPKSCDTFVVLPPLTANGVIFGKNSDRPQGEVQEVVYIPSYTPEEKIKCTYIEVDSEGVTNSVILSKPGWMWGAEMGANSYGVTIGNEAIWSIDESPEANTTVKRLLGMDLVRLGLERGKTAEEALDTIVKLLETYGQGGPCSISDSSLCYHNSFLIADPNCAWVLETVGKHWVAKKITEGFYNISNALTISTKFDKHSEGLLDYAKERGLWNGEGDFSFAGVFSTEPQKGCGRHGAGEKLLEKLTANKSFCEKDMFSILRDTESGICRNISDGFPTQGSQVSTLDASGPSIHWFTATPDPSISVFKPFAFTPNAKVSLHTQCLDEDTKEPHRLYSLHARATASHSKVIRLLRTMEEDCVKELSVMLEQIGTNPEKLHELDELMKDCVETEVKFYR